MRASRVPTPLRIGFDLDGTIADFDSAFRHVEERLFGQSAAVPAGEPEAEEHRDVDNDSVDEDASRALQNPAVAGPGRRERDAVWADIQGTANFWESLQPLEGGAVERIHHLMLQHHWEVFFITQRPPTRGDTVQRQTQRWLVTQGFDLPSVLVVGGSRGAAAGALRLDYHVDDSFQNCLDVLTDSHAKPILVLPNDREPMVGSARKLKIGTAGSISAALDVLEAASTARAQPGVLARLAALVGWQ
ncbi:MAG: hypothetical protein H0X67_05685 [Acidobacteria bacterium]|nr:hypothetical protein [Acidobacteriota bacterium]